MTSEAIHCGPKGRQRPACLGCRNCGVQVAGARPRARRIKVDRLGDIEEEQERYLPCPPCQLRPTAGHPFGKRETRVRLPPLAPRRSRPTAGPLPCKQEMSVRVRWAAPKIHPGVVQQQNVPLIRGRRWCDSTRRDHLEGEAGGNPPLARNEMVLERAWGSRPPPSATEEKPESVAPRPESGGPGNGARVQVSPLPPKFLEARRIVRWPCPSGKRVSCKGLGGRHSPLPPFLEGIWLSVRQARLLNVCP